MLNDKSENETCFVFTSNAVVYSSFVFKEVLPREGVHKKQYCCEISNLNERGGSLRGENEFAGVCKLCAVLEGQELIAFSSGINDF